MEVFINGIGCVSAQQTFETGAFDRLLRNDSANVMPIVPPPYKQYISPIASRRMARGVKNGTVAAAIAVKEANADILDAIITGTGMGCIEDSDKFLTAILDNDEAFLTPTAFIQSTHNTVGAQIALGMQCTAYNFTYVNGAVSFESALLDAKLQIDSDEASSVLIGGIDEMTDYTQKLFELAGFIKKRAPSYDVLNPTTSGAVFSEGATFFVLENKRKPSCYARILDVRIINRIQINEVESRALEFLLQNKLEITDVDALILGYNGDVEFDCYYKTFAANAFADVAQVYYKHLSGEYNTASAFGLYIGANILKTQRLPDVLKANGVVRQTFKYILLYNQYRGIDHSFTLIAL